MLERPSITPTCDVTRLLIRSLSMDIFGIKILMFERELQYLPEIQDIELKLVQWLTVKNQNDS